MSESTTISAQTTQATGVPFALGFCRSDFVHKVTQTYVTQAFSLGLAVISTIVMARALGPSGRGLYAAAFAIATLGVQFGNLGLNCSNTYYLAQEPRLLRVVMGNTLLASGGIGILMGFATYAIFYVNPRWSMVPTPLLLIGLFWIPVGLIYMLCQSMLIALNKVSAYNFIEVINRCVTLLFVILVIAMKAITPQHMMLAALSGILLGAICSYAKLSSHFEGLPRPSLRVLRRHLHIGSKAYLILLFSFMVLKIDTLLVKWILGAEQTGYYSIAASMADYVLLLPTTIAMILFPKLSAINDIVEKWTRAKKAAVGTALSLLPLLLIAGIGSRYAIKLLFGAAFLPAADAFIWLLPGIFTLGVEVVLVQFLNSIGYPPIVIWSWLVSCIANIALNIYVIPRMGIVGASAVSSLTYSLTLLFIVAIVKFHWYKPIKSRGEVNNSLPLPTQESGLA